MHAVGKSDSLYGSDLITYFILLIQQCTHATVSVSNGPRLFPRWKPSVTYVHTYLLDHTGVNCRNRGKIPTHQKCTYVQCDDSFDRSLIKRLFHVFVCLGNGWINLFWSKSTYMHACCWFVWLMAQGYFSVGKLVPFPLCALISCWSLH